MTEGSQEEAPTGDLVSVVMPCHNAEPFLSAAIESVRAQSWPHWELLIVDDRSSDASHEIARRHADADPRIRVFQQPEKGGAAVARNRAIAEARGRWIAFLDSDDMWTPDKLERQIAFMRAKDSAFSCTAFSRIDEHGRGFGKVIPVPERATYDDMLDCSTVGCLTAMYDSARLGKVYMPEVAMREDLVCWLSILKRIEFVHGLDEPLARYRIHTGSRSRNKLRAAWMRWRVMRDHEKLSWAKTMRHFMAYAWLAYRRNM